MMRLACITCIFSILLLLSSDPLAAQGTGTVSGTVAYVENGKFVSEVKNGSVVITLNGREVSIKANEQGDFTVELEIGKWRLVRVLDADGTKLARDKTQARWFTISADRNSRFDVIVQAPRKRLNRTDITNPGTGGWPGLRVSFGVDMSLAQII